MYPINRSLFVIVGARRNGLASGASLLRQHLALRQQCVLFMAFSPRVGCADVCSADQTDSLPQ